MLPQTAPPQIRWSKSPEDRLQTRALIVKTWRSAYAHIFSAEEFDGLGDGRLALHGDWENQRDSLIGTLLAEMDNEIVGIANLALLENHNGELAAFYVTPEWQGKGVGQALWEASLQALRDQGCPAMQIWTLARAQAREFYEHRGCKRGNDDTVALGDHIEPVVSLIINL